MPDPTLPQLPGSAAEAPSFLKMLFEHAVELASPQSALAAHLPEPPKGRTLVVAIGKAAASMARVLEDNWPSAAPLSGIALTRYEHGLPCKSIEVIEASHPVPDDRGYQTTGRIMEEVEALTADDLLVFLVSGGGSALMAMPATGISLDEKKRINQALLMSGAPIGEMNIVRKHLSAVKGGRLALQAAPARVVTLAISDVPGDDPSTIASGPTVADSSTRMDAKNIIAKYGIEISGEVLGYLNSDLSETPKSDHAAFDNCRFDIITRPSGVLDGVVSSLEGHGLSVTTLGAELEGEAREVAIDHAKMALAGSNKADFILSGGETTVTVPAGMQIGKGGRNCEYLLALAIALDGADGIYAIAADTDGIDGSETNAGAIITPDTLARGTALGMDAREFLNRHDAFTYFEALGDLVTTGPTRTNVNDFRAVWVRRTD